VVVGVFRGTAGFASKCLYHGSTRGLTAGGGVATVAMLHVTQKARGAVLGLTRGVTRAHLVRAALESLAYQTRDVVDTMAAEAGRQIRVLRVDGGAAANDFLMQFQADLLATSVDRPKVVETTALGAAMLAGLGAGVWTRAELERVRAVDRVFKPKMPAERRATLYDGWKEAVARVRSGA